MRYIPLILIAIIAGCSKPSQDSNTTDSLAQEDVGGREQHLPPQVADNSIKLSPADLEQVKLKAFLWLHDYQTYSHHPDFVVVKEEFAADENGFRYYLIRENMKSGTFAGDYDYPYDPDMPGELNEGPADTTATEEYTEEELSNMDDLAVQNDPYWSNEGYDIPERDTVEGQVSWKFYPSENPENRLIRVDITGVLTLNNFQYVKYGETIRIPKEVYLASMTIDLSTPVIFAQDKLYLKAKVANLSDTDVSGMNKEQIAFLRNEIFARHGHSFKTEKMIKYFGPKEWYHALDFDAATLLNSFEKQNVDFLKKKEG